MIIGPQPAKEAEIPPEKCSRKLHLTTRPNYLVAKRLCSTSQWCHRRATSLVCFALDVQSLPCHTSNVRRCSRILRTAMPPPPLPQIRPGEFRTFNGSKVFSGNNPWGIVSLFLAAPGYLATLIFFWSISDFSGNVGGDGAAFIFLFMFPLLTAICVAGLCSGLIGAVRTRGKKWIHWLGTALNGLFLLLALFSFTWMSNTMREHRRLYPDDLPPQLK